MPEKLYKEVEKDIPSNIGVYIPKGGKLASIKNSKRQELGVDKDILKDSMIRSLYRESEKVITNNDLLEIDSLRKELARAKKKAYENYRQNMNLRSKLYDKYGEEWKEDL